MFLIGDLIRCHRSPQGGTGRHRLPQAVKHPGCRTSPNTWKTMEINVNLWKSMEIYENLWKSIKIYKIFESQWNPLHVWDICVCKKGHGYILYSKQINSSRICLPKRNHLFKQRKWKSRFSGKHWLWHQNTGQSHYFYENLKWSHGHSGRFAPAGLTGNPDRSSIFDKSVETHFSKSLGLCLGSVFDDLT